MSAETEDHDDNENTYDLDDSAESEVFEWSGINGDGGQVIFPEGTKNWSIKNGLPHGIIRISDKTGLVEVLREVGNKWQAVDKPVRSSLRSIGEATTDS